MTMDIFCLLFLWLEKVLKQLLYRALSVCHKIAGFVLWFLYQNLDNRATDKNRAWSHRADFAIRLIALLVAKANHFQFQQVRGFSFINDIYLQSDKI
jgi:hypothetical protein